MARPKTITLTLAVDDDGIAASQTPAAGGVQDLTLAGALTSGGTWESTTAQQLGITSAGNDSGRTFTVYGDYYDSNSRKTLSGSEAVTGANTDVAETTNYFFKVTQITTDDDTAGAVKVGPVDEAISQIIPLNWRRREDIGVSASVSGTINYDVDVTLSDIQDLTVTPAYLADASVLASKTANSDMTLDGGATGIRVQVNTGTDSGAVTVDIVQS